MEHNIAQLSDLKISALKIYFLKALRRLQHFMTFQSSSFESHISNDKIESISAIEQLQMSTTHYYYYRCSIVKRMSIVNKHVFARKYTKYLNIFELSYLKVQLTSR